LAGDQRDRVADERDRTGGRRDLDGDQRDRVGDQRDRAGDERDRAADERDRVGDARDRAGERRDQAGELRDRAADVRDHAGDERDRTGDERDRASDRRDQVREEFETSIIREIPRDALDRSMLARREAAADRKRASRDRQSGALERGEAELDRKTALIDRGEGAAHRLQASADREASAKDRENAVLDGLTGVYRRGPGLAELEREIGRAKRALHPLVVAFFDVDHLKDVNDSQGHVAGDRMLQQVVDAIRGAVRSFDLIIRYGGDEFVCAFPGITVAEVAKRVATIDAALSRASEPGSVTAGFAELATDDSPDELIDRADADLYRVREQQRA
jgi:diguanylate cyclase (GGDEF)-like protein